MDQRETKQKDKGPNYTLRNTIISISNYMKLQFILFA